MSVCFPLSLSSPPLSFSYSQFPPSSTHHHPPTHPYMYLQPSCNRPGIGSRGWTSSSGAYMGVGGWVKCLCCALFYLHTSPTHPPTPPTHPPIFLLSQVDAGPPGVLALSGRGDCLSSFLPVEESDASPFCCSFFDGLQQPDAGGRRGGRYVWEEWVGGWVGGWMNERRYAPLNGCRRW